MDQDNHVHFGKFNLIENMSFLGSASITYQIKDSQANGQYVYLWCLPQSLAHPHFLHFQNTPLNYLIIIFKIYCLSELLLIPEIMLSLVFLI